MKLCFLLVLFCSFTSSSARRYFCDSDGTCDPGYGCREDVCRKGEPPQLITTPKPYVPTTTTEEIEIIETTLPPPIPTEPEPEPETPSPPLPTEAAEPEITLAPQIPTEPQNEEPELELETTTLPIEHQEETDVTTTLSPLTSPSPKLHSICHTSVNCVYGFWCKKGKCVRKSRRPPSSSPHHPTSQSPPPHHIYHHQKCTLNTDCHGFRHYCMNGYCIL